MTLPLPILGLYLGLLVLGIGLCSWTSHSTAETEDARRVTNAVERAGLSHLSRPLRLSGALTLVFSLLCCGFAVSRGASGVWFFGVPLVVPPLVASTVFFAARKLLHASGQLISASSADAQITLTSRMTVGTVLVCSSVSGLIFPGIYSLALLEMTPEMARLLILFAGSSVGISLVVFARSASAAQAAVGQDVGNEDGPHAASLARLVAATFHTPLLRLLSFFALDLLGHCLLLAVPPLASSESAPLWLYPHLLKLLGLFALLFAGLVVRATEEESGVEGWFRGAAVYLVLMIAGAWSLGSELPTDIGRSVPAGLTFLYLAVGLSVWLAPRPWSVLTPRTLGESAFATLPVAAGFLGLVLLLAIFSNQTRVEGALPEGALLRLLLAGALAAAPVGLVWLLARDVIEGCAKTKRLAFSNTGREQVPKVRPSHRLLLALPLLALVIAHSALGSGTGMKPPISEVALPVMSLAAAFSGLVLAALLGQVERACSKPVLALSNLVETDEAARVQARQNTPAPVNFEAAVLLCREASARGDVSWLLLCVVPLLSTILGRLLVEPATLHSLTIGFGLGALLLGVGLELLEHNSTSTARRALAALSFIAGLTQTLWLLTAGTLPT